jgi:hypothetical protein
MCGYCKSPKACDCPTDVCNCMNGGYCSRKGCEHYAKPNADDSNDADSSSE